MENNKKMEFVHLKIAVNNIKFRKHSENLKAIKKKEKKKRTQVKGMLLGSIQFYRNY